MSDLEAIPEEDTPVAVTTGAPPELQCAADTMLADEAASMKGKGGEGTIYHTIIHHHTPYTITVLIRSYTIHHHFADIASLSSLC
jgi:hypothetical protein